MTRCGTWRPAQKGSSTSRSAPEPIPPTRRWLPGGGATERAIARRVPVRRRSLQGDRAAPPRELLPLHALPAEVGNRRLRPGPRRTGLPRHPLRRGARPCLATRQRLCQGVLLGMRVAALEPRPGRPRGDQRTPRRLRRRPGHPSATSAVRRLRGELGGDPGRRSTQVQRESAAPLAHHLPFLGAHVILNSMVQYPTTVDRAFTALADPTRRAVLERLGSGSATISELAEPFGMSLTGMKKHIRLLEAAELVTTEKIGRVRRCMLVPYAFEGISTWLQRLDRFAQVVERTRGER